MIAEITGLVLEGEELNLKRASGGWLLHYLGGSFGLSPWSELKRLIFLLRFGGRNFGPRMMHASALCPILPQHSQINFCLMQRSAITGWRVAASLFLEDEGQK